MKKAMYFLFILLLGLSMPANAATISNYSGLWQANDGDVNEISLDTISGETQDFNLYIYSPDETQFLLVLDKNSGITGRTVYFTLEGTTWYAGLSYNSKDIALGSLPQYYIRFWDGSNYINTYDVEQVDKDKSYKLIVISGSLKDTFIQVDAAMPIGGPPVPLPGSAVLLGSGLLGLALVWRRQQRRR